MKTAPQRFFSRDDKDSLRDMEEIFGRESIFFIEKKENGRWLEEMTPMGPVTTIDPLKAMVFKTLGQAMEFKVKHSLLDLFGWITTEHEFPKP